MREKKYITEIVGNKMRFKEVKEDNKFKFNKNKKNSKDTSKFTKSKPINNKPTKPVVKKTVIDRVVKHDRPELVVGESNNISTIVAASKIQVVAIPLTDIASATISPATPLVGYDYLVRVYNIKYTRESKEVIHEYITLASANKILMHILNDVSSRIDKYSKDQNSIYCLLHHKYVVPIMDICTRIRIYDVALLDTSKLVAVNYREFKIMLDALVEKLEIGLSYEFKKYPIK